MRKTYEDAAREFSRFVRIAPIDLTRGLAQMCQAIADAELVLQGKQHAVLYGYEIALLKVEIISLNAEIGTLNKHRSSKLYVE